MQRKSSSSVRIFYPRLNKEELLEKLQERLGILDRELPLSMVVLFGSYARGNYTVASDVDLLVVYKGSLREDAFSVVKKTLDIQLLQPHVYTEEQYLSLKGTIERMIGGGITLFSTTDA